MGGVGCVREGCDVIPGRVCIGGERCVSEGCDVVGGVCIGEGCGVVGGVREECGV